MASLEQWVRDFPPITRTYMAAALLTTAACALDVISPFSLYFSFTMVWEKGQFWRLFTNFFFFGAKFSLEFIFHMFFLLEEGSFRGRTADFFFMILFGASLLTIVAPFAQVHFLGNPLVFMMVYIWSRRNPFVRMSFWGLFTFTAPYLPWVMLGFGFLLGNDAMVDFVGILIGHLYYFLWDICPIMFGRRILYTPRLIELIFAGVGGQPAADQPIIVDFENERIIQQQMQARQQGQQQQQQQPEDEGVILAD